ncbi:MAG: fibronectin type III domain-containing protein [Candidatus Thiodiazotropha sp.]
MARFIQILTLVMSVSLLSACGNTDSSGSSTPTSSQSVPASNGSVTISWTPPSTRSDGSYLSSNDLAGYRVYLGTSSSSLSPREDLADIEMTEYTVKNLPAGDYYFAVTAYDSDGQESGYSQVVLIRLS